MPSPPEHSEFPPSSMERLIKCPASWSRSKGKQKVESPAMREGTLAHAVLENKLKGRAPSDWVLPKWAKHRDITSELRAAVDEAVAVVEELRDGWPAEEGIEEKVSLASWGMPQIWGTADYVRRRYLDRLIIMDYKHGAGVWVSADSDQLRCYAAGAAGDNLHKHGEVELIIVQPRCLRKGDQTIRHHVHQAVELADWVNDLLTPAIVDAKSNQPTANPGDKQCQWCEGKTKCPEYHAASASVVGMQFADLCVAETVKTPIIPGDAETLGRIYRQLPLLKGWMKTIEQEVAAATMAGQATGLKYVAGRNSRSWADENGVIKYLREEYELDDEALYGEPALKGPAALEKLIPGGKKLLAEFVATKAGGPVLALIEDRRPAVENAAVLSFADLEDE